MDLGKQLHANSAAGRTAGYSSRSNSASSIASSSPGPPLSPPANGFYGDKSELWQSAMKKVVRSVVSLNFAYPSPFDTEGPYVSEATGFVVDEKRGIIMTNRHVVGPGPFSGFAVFYNHEEVPVKAIYRDPVHDFGFLQFDVGAVRHMSLHSLELRPERAQVGCEIRVVGNDAGEKLSILAGYISRVDRNAPEYGDLSYNDFNTEYIQAAASASGGSSGSPVVDIDGTVLALQAGGSTTASTDFFLPLFRGKRALECIQNGVPVTRGTIQVQWELKPYDECERLGLDIEEENKARRDHPETIGLLVAECILPEGPADGLIEEGDILVDINGKPTVQFRDVDDIMDTNVGHEVEITVIRNSERITSNFLVQDLHSITPAKYALVSGAIMHDVSYQLASYYALPVKGVYIADTGLAFRVGKERTGWILEELDHKPVSDLTELIEVAKSLPDRKRVSARLRHFTDLNSVKSMVVELDRHWNRDIVVATRNDETGLWDMETVAKAVSSEPPIRHRAKFPRVSSGNDEIVTRLMRKFVKVESRVPLSIEGLGSADWKEYGLVVDAERGYVLVSRSCVPHFMCDVSIVIAESVIVPARVVFLHPQQNYAVVQYDAALVDAPIETATFSTEPLEQGSKVEFYGYGGNMRLFTTETKVTDISIQNIPVGVDLAPRFRATNLESLGFDTSMLSDCVSGVLSDSDGTIRAIWSTFMGDVTSNGRDRLFRLALDTTSIGPVIAKLRESESFDPRFVDVECSALQVVSARIRGVSDEWIERVTDAHPQRPEFLQALRVASSMAAYVREGDVLVALDGKALISPAQLMNLDQESVNLTLIRSGHEHTVNVPTLAASSVVTSTVVSWCGLLVHAPHHAVLQQVKEPPSMVYVVSVGFGSPADQYGLGTTLFVTHVAGTAVHTVDDFYEAVKEISDETYVKLRIVTFEGIPFARTLRTNYHYHKTWRRDLVAGEWSRQGMD